MKKRTLLLGVISVIATTTALVACEKEPPHTHDYADTVVTPTCTEQGYTVHTCACGDTVTDTYVAPIAEGHDYERLVVSSTCEEAGYERDICILCGDMGEQTVLEANGHNWVLDSIVVESLATRNAGVYTCQTCGETSERTISFADLGVPILSFDGDISTMTKDNKVVLDVSYESADESFVCDATLKWQGSSSLSYPKKNYTMQLLKEGTDKKNKVELDEGWGKQSKYCLKANWIDFSQMRNVVSGQIYSEIVNSRGFDDEQGALANGGAVDGFPIVIFINGDFQGLYTLNIPKDKWMFGMEDDEEDDDVVTKHAILAGDGWTDGAKLKEPINADYVSSGVELEYYSTEETIGDAWVVESFNNMVNFVNANDGEAFRNGIGEFVNVDRTIDSMLYTWFILAADNTAKNILWVTYDGIHWYSSMYDMDGTWGIAWNGQLSEGNSDLQLSWYTLSCNELWRKIFVNFNEEITKRYFELRTSVLSKENMKEKFTAFSNKISSIVVEAEQEKWTTVPGQETNNLAQIHDYIDMRCDVMDRYFLNRAFN